MGSVETDQSRLGILERQKKLERKLTADYLIGDIPLNRYKILLNAVGVPPLDLRKLAEELQNRR